MTDEIMVKLDAIKPPHLAKKRTTVIKIAFAQATQQPIKEVFEAEDTCNSSNWYSRWQYIPEITEALYACRERAAQWIDQQTAAMEYYYNSLRRQAIFSRAAEAPHALAKVMNDPSQKGSDRISAANALLTWADPKAAAQASPAPPPASLDQTLTLIQSVDDLNDDELKSLIQNLQAAVGQGAVGLSAEEQPESG